MKKKKYSAEYISYVESGESAAVFIARDIVKSIDATGKWIDILDLEGNKNKDGRWDFRYFTIELFPRKIQPKYPPKASEDDRKYITWETAHMDIQNQRKQGYKGKKYKICPRLVRHDKEKNAKSQWSYDIVSIKAL